MRLATRAAGFLPAGTLSAGTDPAVLGVGSCALLATANRALMSGRLP
jgi:hypothetical protein